MPSVEAVASVVVVVGLSIWGVSSNGTENWNRIVIRRVFPGLRGRNRPVFPRIALELDVNCSRTRRISNLL